MRATFTVQAGPGLPVAYDDGNVSGFRPVCAAVPSSPKRPGLVTCREPLQAADAAVTVTVERETASR